MSRNKNIITHAKAIAGLERAAYFAKAGSTAADWRGGRKVVQADRKKTSSKRACRSRVRL